jgi:hypothetical protein
MTADERSALAAAAGANGDVITSIGIGSAEGNDCRSNGIGNDGTSNGGGKGGCGSGTGTSEDSWSEGHCRSVLK